EIDKLDPDGHCSRALYGLYQKWFYQQLIETLPPFITFTYLQENAIGLIPKQTHYLLKTDRHSLQSGRVILAVGHHQVSLTEEE
ncbi:FAD/NAD(P)-binding protein, partial [Escherichia coli]